MCLTEVSGGLPAETTSEFQSRAHTVTHATQTSLAVKMRGAEREDETLVPLKSIKLWVWVFSSYSTLPHGSMCRRLGGKRESNFPTHPTLSNLICHCLEGKAGECFKANTGGPQKTSSKNNQALTKIKPFKTWNWWKYMCLPNVIKKKKPCSGEEKLNIG